ncbi:hypothetical protein EBU71_07405 [bacterium]|nr:hypothetical protein [Candidatus Elulimicrobium humile]
MNNILRRDMNKRIISLQEFEKLVNKICRDISLSSWRPDYVVGITRGGLIPAVMISHYFDVPMHTLKISLRDEAEEDCESNLWMAEHALGYPKSEISIEDDSDVYNILDAAGALLEAGDSYKNILIVDDINDSGATLNWLMKDWQSSCLPDDPDWQHVWNNNVKFAVIVDNLSSKCNVKMDYIGFEVNKAENDVWVEFPYEEWWTK